METHLIYGNGIDGKAIFLQSPLLKAIILLFSKNFPMVIIIKMAKYLNAEIGPVQDGLEILLQYFHMRFHVHGRVVSPE